MNKKPKIFKPNMDFIDNNKKSYCSFLDDELNVNTSDDSRDDGDKEERVLDFINRLSNTNSYVFNKKITIVTKDEKINARIAGKIGNRLITLDNKSININDIIDIYEQ